MKIRTMKLREAHKIDKGSSSVCSIVWSSNCDYIVTASSSDNSICIHDAVFQSNAPKILRNHREGVTALALSPNSTCLASGSLDHSVKLYKFPGGDFETNITRFTLPIRALAFNKSGTILAAAGDDEGIKLVNTIDGTIARVLKAHKEPVTSLAFDPKSEYLASMDSFGTVILWELQTGSTLHVLKGIAPNNGTDVSVMNVLAWSPDGEMLAVPGLRNDVVMYDRDTAEKLFSLRGDHSQPICFLSWSPNGKYMATSGLDMQILIWDVEKKLDIDRQKFSECISSIAWKPLGNALAVIDVMGKFGVWESAVPSSMKSPTEDIPSSKNSNGLLLFDEEEPSASGNLSNINENREGETEILSKKRLRKQDKYEDDWEEDLNVEFKSFPKVESRKKAVRGQDSNLDGKIESQIIKMASGYKMQVAFQPGATPAQTGKRHFLCYNMLGSITTMEHDGYSHIEIDFHDTSSGPRVPAMTDYFGFTMASLNENGSVFANPCKGDKSMSTLMYRPLRSWANNSEWSMRFEGEEVRAVALGSAWVAAVTSLNYLRIFTDGGLQRDIIALDGPVVTAAGYMDELVVVTHTSPSLPSDEQMLRFRVLNIRHRTEALKGRVPLTPGSCLTWIGFSDEGQLSSFDSKGVLRVFTNRYKGSWLPLFSANKLKNSNENYWVVGLNTSKLFCILCKSPESFPQCTPKPVLTLLDLSLPVASSDLGADNLENELMINSMHLSQMQKVIEDKAASYEDTSSLEDEAFNQQIVVDRCILRLIASCCNSDKLVRATELVKLLSLEKSIRGAIKLVTTLKQPNLADRFNNILEEKLLSDKVVLPQRNCNSKFDDCSTSTSVKLEINTTSQGKPPTQIKTFPLTSLIRKRNAEEATTDGNGKIEHNDNNNINITLEKTSDLKSIEKLKKDLKPKEVNQQAIPSSRPANPFAKSSKNQESSSLFQSLKKMKASPEDS